jgi:hypothetical protein
MANVEPRCRHLDREPHRSAEASAIPHFARRYACILIFQSLRRASIKTPPMRRRKSGTATISTHWFTRATPHPAPTWKMASKTIGFTCAKNIQTREI